jgi:hypothetical protein
MSSRLSIRRGEFFEFQKGKMGGKYSHINEILIKSRFPALRAGQKSIRRKPAKCLTKPSKNP